MTNVVAFFSGLLFAIGLAVAGMTQPHKIIGFLDILGDWDPSLVFVMAGAVAVHILAYRLMGKRGRPMFESQWYLPSAKDISMPLIIGSGIFGIGWGLSGFCPGPAIVSLGSGSLKAIVMVCAMNLGMGARNYWDSKVKGSKSE